MRGQYRHRQRPEAGRRAASRGYRQSEEAAGAQAKDEFAKDEFAKDEAEDNEKEEEPSRGFTPYMQGIAAWRLLLESERRACATAAATASSGGEAQLSTSEAAQWKERTTISEAGWLPSRAAGCHV